ncbi:MAG: hypothetical protein WA719_00690 [Thermoplasmata archaeon]
MRRSRPTLAEAEFDTFGAALGVAVIAGGLAALAPFLNSLTVALVALAAAGWASGLPRHGMSRSPSLSEARCGALLPVGFGSVGFFLLPEPFALFRGLVLALSLVPLWLYERGPGVGRMTRRAEVP